MGGQNEDDDANKDSQQVSKDHSEPSIGKRIGEFLILCVYLVVETFDVWPHSRLLAVVSFPIGIAGLLLLDGGFSKRRIGQLTAAVFTAGLLLYFFVPKESAPEVEVSGVLLSGNDPTPPNACDQNNQLPFGALRILMGTSAAAMTKDGKISALKIGTCRVLSMERKSEKISLSVSLYDASGKMIAVTEDGAIHAITGQNVRMRRDGTLTTFIIEDGGGKELLYVKYLNSTTVQARGIFGCPGHAPVVIQDGQPIKGISGACLMNADVAIAIK